ncbi:MAG: hypothetical protein ACREJI_09945, partial [Candidatus Methylomirabilales bacterium]
PGKRGWRSGRRRSRAAARNGIVGAGPGADGIPVEARSRSPSGVHSRTSPPLAARIGESPPLRGLVQGLLWPLVGVAWLTLHPAVGGSVLVGVGVITGLVGYRRRKSRPTQS